MIGNTSKITSELTILIERMSVLRLQPVLSQAEHQELLDLTSRFSTLHLDQYEQHLGGKKEATTKKTKKQSSPYAIRSCAEQYLSRRGGGNPPPPPPPSATV